MSRKDLIEPLLEKRGGGGGEATTVTTCPPIKKAKGEDVKLLEALFGHLDAKTAEGDAAAVKLIQSRPDLLNLEGQSSHITPLMKAALVARDVVVTEILKIDESLVHQVISNEFTPLHFATKNGHREICELLLARGANVNAANKDGITPLHIAAYNDHRETCEFLLERGANINAANKDGFTPLHIAAQNGHRETCKLLLTKGANINAANKYRGTPLYIAAQNDMRETCKLLLAFGADPKASTSLAYLRRTPSAVAKLNNHQDIVNDFKHRASLSLEAREAIYDAIRKDVFSRLGEREKGKAVTRPRDAVVGAGAAAVGHSDQRGRI